MTESQDKVLRRVQELKDQVEIEKSNRAQLEQKLVEKEKIIESSKNQVRIVNDNNFFIINLLKNIK